MMPFVSSRKPMTKALFWGSIGLLVYTYLLFPLLTLLRGKLFPRPLMLENDNNSELPSISLLIAAYNEAENDSQPTKNRHH